MPVTDALLSLPAAPFSGGQGGYKSDAALQEDINLSRKVLGDPRWPVTPALRSRCVEWLETIIEASDDDRARANALRTLVVIDKLNIEHAKLLLAIEKQQAPQELNVNVSGEIGHAVTHTLVARIAQLETAFAGAADRQSESGVPSNGTGKPVDS